MRWFLKYEHSRGSRQTLHIYQPPNNVLFRCDQKSNRKTLKEQWPEINFTEDPGPN